MRCFVVIFFFFAVESYAQINSPLLKKVESLYNEAKIQGQAGDRVKAISLLNQVLKIDSLYYMAYFGLADIYHETKEIQPEKEALIRGLKIGKDRFPSGYKFLAELLYQGAAYSEAYENIGHYSTLKSRLTIDENRLLESCRFAMQAVQSPVPFQPQNAGENINSGADEYWPSLNGEGNTMVFTRLVVHDQNGKKLSYPQEDFYVSRNDSSGWQKAIPLGPPVNSGENEGAQCISADGRLLFFTGCNRPEGLGSCDIYMSVKQKGRWSEPVNLGNPVNTAAWESQPSISADGRWLYFVSNRAGGKGKMDIWRAQKLGVSPGGFPVYGKAANLVAVNTSGNENSPFIHADGKTLFFSSDFWPGMGGKDLFFISPDSLKKMTPQNLGYPINTSRDEDGMVVEVSGEKAWFTSNSSGFGGRDIFAFILPEMARPNPVSWVKGTVINRKTRQPVNPDILLSDLINEQTIQHLYPFENDGEFLFCLPAGGNYGLNIAKPGYLFHSENFNLAGAFTRNQPMNLKIELDPIETGKTTILKNIFFETDSFRLKSESGVQLKEMIEFMKTNPKLVIEIGGHTDLQGSEKYNLNLSTRRADAVVQYLTGKGVPPSRLRSKGYGYSVPVADNTTEAGRAQNRRTEFRILEVNMGEK